MTPTIQPHFIGSPKTTPPRKTIFHTKTIILIMITGGIVLVLIASYFYFYTNKTDNQIQQNQNLVADISTVDTRTNEIEKIPDTVSDSPVKPKITMSQQDILDYKTYVANLKKIVDNQDPRVALVQLTKDVNTVKVVQEHCHSLTHTIGNEALVKYNNSIQTAMEYYVDTCGGGYVHGLVEKYLKISSNPENEIYTLCPGFSDGVCVHGLGHGLMLMYSYDVPKSVAGCQKIPAGAQVSCAEGVFMENFDAENADDSEKPYLYSQDPASLCNQYTGGYRNTCYYYLGRYLFKILVDPYKSLSKCTEIENTTDKITCIRGMSAGILRSDLYHPEKMEDYCNSVPIAKSSCIEGSVNYHLLMLKSENETRTTMCNQFVTTSNQSLCNSLVDKSPFRE